LQQVEKHLTSLPTQQFALLTWDSKGAP